MKNKKRKTFNFFIILKSKNKNDNKFCSLDYIILVMNVTKLNFK